MLPTSWAMAQDVDIHGKTPIDELPSLNDVRPDETISQRLAREEMQQGIHTGAWLISPSVHAGIGHDDNIFGTSNGTGTGKIGDFYANYGGTLGAQYNYDNLTANITAHADDNRYFSQGNEDYWTAGTRIDVTDQLTHNFGLIAGGGFIHDIIPRGSPLDTNGTTPESYNIFDVEPGIQIGDPQSNFATIQIGYDQSYYAPVPTATTTISGAPRNRQEVFGDVRLNHVFHDQQLVYVEIRPDGRSYAIDPDPTGFRRDNNGIRVDAGVQFDTRIFLVKAYAGVQRREYADPRFGTISEPDIGLDVLWAPSRNTTVDFNFVHEYAENVYENGAVNSPGYRHNMETISVEHEFRHNLIGTVALSYDAQKFVTANRSYDILAPAATIQYMFNNGLSLKFSYNYTYQNEANPDLSLYRNVFLMNVIKRF